MFKNKIKDRQTDWPRDRRWSEKLIWNFSSGELKLYLYSIYTIYSRLLTSIVYYLYVSISIVLRLNDWSSFFYRFLQQWDRLLPPVQTFMKTVVEIFFPPIPTYVTQLVPKHFVLLLVVAAVSHIENIFVLIIMYTENERIVYTIQIDR